jgi:hypothetical protein
MRTVNWSYPGLVRHFRKYSGLLRELREDHRLSGNYYCSSAIERENMVRVRSF